MLYNLSYLAPKLHGSVATWPPLAVMLYNLSCWALELHGSVATWPSLSSYAL